MAANKTIKFFISSTFKDFLKERNALQNFVFPRLKKLCQKKGFSFQPVDLRWGVTPESSDDNQTMNFCLNEVKRCSSEPKPNLLVLLGQRYGWGPLPSEINAIDFENDIESNKLSEDDKEFLRIWYLPDTNSKCYLRDENSMTYVYYLKDKKNTKNWSEDEKRLKEILKKAVGNNDKYKDFFKSATELEIRDALDNQFKGNEDNTLVYLRSFSTIDDQDYYENSDEKQKKLNDLKSDLNKDIYSLVEQNNIDLNLYKESDKDTQKFSVLSSDLQYFCNEIFEKYSENIRREMNNYTKRSDLAVEVEEQKKFLEFKSEVVLGRDVEVDDIKKFVKNPTEQYYLLYGKSGSGKSSVMAKTIFDLTSKESKEKLSDEYKVLYRFIGTTAHTSSPRDTFEHIYWELKDEEKKPFIEYEDHKFYAQFRELLKSYDKQIILFMDAVDQFNTYDSLSIFLDELPENVKVVFSILNKHQQEDNVDTLYYERLINSISKAYELDVLKNSNEAILKSWLDKDKRELTKKQSEYLLDKCLTQTPLYLRLAFTIAKEWKSGYFEYEDDIQGDEKSLILKFFKKLKENHYHKNNLIERVLGFVSASKDGLSESELIDLLSREEDILENYERKNSSYPKLSKLPDAIFSRLYFHMQEFFTEKLIDDKMLITPFHRIISETIKKEYYETKAEQLHKDLADYFLTLQDTEKVWDERYNNLHMLSEIPYQLFKSNNSEGLKEILFDLEFSGSVYNNHKHESFRMIMEKAHELDNITEDEMYVWESFYRENEHLITKVDEEMWKPHQSLFQLAYDDGDNSPLSQKAENILNIQKLDFIWLKRKNRDKKFIRLGLKKLLVQNNIINLDIINNNIVCMTNEVIYFFDIKGNLLNKIDAKKYKKYVDHRDINYKINSNSLVYIWFSGIRETNFKLSCCNNNGYLVHDTMEHTSCIKDILFLSKKIITWTEENKIYIWEDNILKIVIEDDKDCITYKNRILCYGIKKLKKINEERFLSISSAYDFIKVWNYNGEVIFILDGFRASDVLILPTGEFLGWSTEKTEMIIWKSNGEVLKIFNKKVKIDYTKKVYIEMNYIISISEEDVKNYWTFDGILIKTEKFKRQINEYGFFESEKPQKMKINNVNIDWSNGLKFVEKDYIKNKDKKSDYLLVSSIIYKKNNYPKHLIRFGTEDLPIRWNENDMILISHRNNITLNIKGNQIELLGHLSTIKGILVHKGKYITFDEHGKIIIWSLKGEKILENTAHNSWINGAIVINDEKFLTYGNDGKVIIWNFNGNKEFKFIAHEGCISYVELLNNDTIITYSNSCYHKSDYQINIFNTKGKLKHKCIFPNNLCTSSLILA